VERGGFLVGIKGKVGYDGEVKNRKDESKECLKGIRIHFLGGKRGY
jgi:hypothetical protein